MLSLIICSRHTDISIELKENIQSTIGIEYELVIVDNSRNEHSIFSAYNEGVRRSRYPYLCFMHEDILYHTKNWGKLVIEHFQNPKAGIIGVAGGHFLPNVPASWSSTKCVSLNLIQSSSSSANTSGSHFSKFPYTNGKTAEVVAIDGFWFCCRKNLFDTITFDEKTLGNFHYYDADICLQTIKAGYKINVVPNILIEHFSWGKLDETFFENANLFYKKWQKALPQIAGITLSKYEIQLRSEFANETFSISRELCNVQTQLLSIKGSKAYRLGKFILKPLSSIRRRFQKQ